MSKTVQRHGIVQDCYEYYEEQLRYCFEERDKRMCTEISLHDGYIILMADDNDHIQVEIYHDEGKGVGKPTPNLEKAIKAALPSWGTMYDAWLEEKELEEEELHSSFESSTLDPGFGSWEDYYHYMYG